MLPSFLCINRNNEYPHFKWSYLEVVNLTSESSNNNTIPFAYLYMMPNLSIKLHLESLKGVVLTWNVDRGTDRETGWYLYVPPNFVYVG